MSHLRGNLKKQTVKQNSLKISFKKQVKKLIKSITRGLHTTNSRAIKQSWYDSIPKSILPSLIDV